MKKNKYSRKKGMILIWRGKGQWQAYATVWIWARRLSAIISEISVFKEKPDIHRKRERFP